MEKILPDFNKELPYAISFAEAADLLIGIPAKVLTNHPREIVVKGKITVKELKRLQKVKVEVNIVGKNGNYIVSTGTTKTGDPNYGDRRLERFENFFSRRIAILDGKGMHTHTNRIAIDNFPSPGDVEFYSDSGRQEYKGLLGSRRYLTLFKGLNPEVVQEKDVLKDVSMVNLLGYFFANVDEYELVEKLKSVGSFEKIIEWKDEEACQRLIDEYFEQE